MRFVSAAIASLVLSPALYLGAWGDRSLPLEWKLWANALALGGAVAGIPLCRLADEELRDGQAQRARKNALKAADYAASTQQGINQIQSAYGIGRMPQWQDKLLADMAQMQSLIGRFEAMGQGETQGDLAIESAPQVVPFDNILDAGTGIALLGNSGSGKSCVARYLIGLMGPDTQVLVIDPHNDDCWQDLPVVWEPDQIALQLRLILDELRDRKANQRRGPKVAILCDEWPSVRADLNSRKETKGLPDEYLMRAGSEFRKFKMLNIFMSQTGNVKPLGLEGNGDMLSNYTLVRLNKIAVKYAKNLRHGQDILTALQRQAYSCLIDDELSIHPTHSEYDSVRDGNVPRNLRPFSPAPLTIPNVFDLAPEPAEDMVKDATIVESLNRAYNAPDACPDPSTLSDGEREILARIQWLKAEGITRKADIIKAIWGVSAGASSRYASASEIFDRLIQFV